MKLGQGIKTQKAREAVDKFPELSGKKLGEWLKEKNPILYKNSEEARYYVRAVIGKAGRRNGGIVPTHKDIYKGLPKGEKNDYSPHILPPGKYGILSDIHIPYHDEEAVYIALDHCKKLGVKNLILNGDIIDCYQVSRFDKEPDKPSIKMEFEILKEWLDELTKEFNVIYKTGNHEDRWAQYLLSSSAALWDFQFKSFAWMINEYYKLPQVTVINNKRIITAGKLNIAHGHEFGVSVFSPVNIARGFFLRAKANVIGGHHHQTSEHIESNMNGEITGAWSTGCLCDLHPKYMPLNRWNHGFSYINVEPDGQFEVFNKKIIGGTVK